MDYYSFTDPDDKVSFLNDCLTVCATPDRRLLS